jgi:predicted RNase H-like HicB family nuclease
MTGEITKSSAAFRSVKLYKMMLPAVKIRANVCYNMYRYNSRSVFMKIEIEREEDGRWIAEIPELPGVMAYGNKRSEAIAGAQVLALRVLADRLEHGEEIPEINEVFAVSA